MNPGKLFMLAWRVIPHLPGPLVRGIFDFIARITYRRNGPSIQQLRKNIERIAAPGANIEKLTQWGIRHYMRYYCESFQLPGFSEERVDALLRGVNHEKTQKMIIGGQSVYALMSHTGNWDLAGAWAGRHVGHVLTVAEKLEPEQLFQEFLAFRENLGMTIVPYVKGSSAFRQLLKRSTQSPCFVPLLSDRDLGKSGVWVDVAGHPMRVAPGPAALAVATKQPLVAIFSYHERIEGERRRRGKSPWGVVLEFSEPLQPNPDLDNKSAVADLLQQWADAFTVFLRKHPDHWHMLQPVFQDDLDLDRLAKATQ